jgi:MYXO-CTERM domain-containing protein
MSKAPLTWLAGLQLVAIVITVVTFAGSVDAQPASRPHPRIWLDAATIQGIKAQGSVPDGPVARGAARCRAARETPTEYATGGWQGFEFVTTLSGCLLSWQATQSPDDLVTAIKYWNVLLDDYQNVGDSLGGDSVVQHDTGYAMRTFAPYSALAYDWLHDAPGVTEALRAHARARFDAWTTFYSTSGYLRHMPAANYQAGYLFAATLMAIAEAGEAGTAGDAHWANVRDVIWGKDTAPALGAGGVLEGGDWPEGWQYGPLSVLEIALAARAMQESGATIDGARAWADSLVARFQYGLTPVTHQTYVVGDTGIEPGAPNLGPANGALIAAIAGPAGEASRAWARRLEGDLALTNANENPLFDALAAANGGPSEAFPPDAPKSYLASGAGNYYVRGGLSGHTVSGVFQCSRRRVDDHQHNDAGNWVLTRGADDLIVDPSPYGSLSSLTGNAPSIDSKVLPSGYSPSQAGWGKTTSLVWAKQWQSGVAAGRCDYADQFRTDDTPSDVANALRDFVLVPHGADATVVLVDRMVTGDASRGMHLRVRTPMDLALSDSNVASGSMGTSSLTIRKMWPAGGTTNVRPMPRTPECSSSNRACDISRLASGMEYRADIAGPSAVAIHVVDVQGVGAAAPTSALVTGSGYRGVLLDRGDDRVVVVTNDTPAAISTAPLVYRVPAGSGALHVVLDAPTGTTGRSDMTGVSDGADCKLTVTARSESSGGYEGRPLVARITSACNVVEEGKEGPLDTGPPSRTGTDGGAGSGTIGAGGANGAIDSMVPGMPGAGGGAATEGGTSRTRTGNPSPDGATGDVQGGCSCRATSGEPKPWPMAFLVMGWILAESRRSRSRARPQGVREPRDELARVVARE